MQKGEKVKYKIIEASLLLQTASDVATNNNTMVSFIRLQGQSLQRLNSLFSQLSHFSSENSFSINGRVNTVGLDGDDNSTLVLQEQVGVQGDNTSSVRLGHISENGVDHTDQHTVLLWVTSVVNDWDDIRSLLSHADQLSTWSVRKFNCVNQTFRANHIRNVGDRSTRGSTQVQNLLSWSNAQLINTTHNTSSQLGSERVPHTVLDLSWSGTFLLSWFVNSHTLLTVNGFTWSHVSGNQQILLTSSNKNTSMSVWFDDNLGSASSTTSGATSTTSSTTTGTTTSTTSGTTSTTKTASGTTSATTGTAKTASSTASAASAAAKSTTGAASAASLITECHF
ncbi:hypothetical protein CLUG_03750 [Clavispora lusitaniae ATCC 42720]|uniref:Uncharacterized protein n=1 Tax=Clavispora lusitaniae (strain ATCC 42720) TaxID=306902 RepID=C4Y6G7_CLAL4|nr:uncharacterized protein CLUG_03750 [Clavispora lusitaniae ATCC 42720]EEQ39623.1 hypothetical protein CLUG_03750 [Clavispora lusitaniae ATCC 42720]